MAQMNAVSRTYPLALMLVIASLTPVEGREQTPARRPRAEDRGPLTPGVRVSGTLRGDVAHLYLIDIPASSAGEITFEGIPQAWFNILDEHGGLSGAMVGAPERALAILFTKAPLRLAVIRGPNAGGR